MPLIEEVEGRFTWTTQGVEKVQTAKTALDQLEQAEQKVTGRAPAFTAASKQVSDAAGKIGDAARESARRTDDAARSTGALGELHKLSGERMARYGTAVALVSGQMRELGVSNDIVARGLTVTMEGFTGMLGPIGLAVVALGAVATVVASLATEQGRLREATIGATDALITQASRTPPGLAATAAGEVLVHNEEELRRERSRLLGAIARERDRKSGQVIRSPLFGTIDMSASDRTIARADAAIAKLTGQLNEVEAKLAKIAEYKTNLAVQASYPISQEDMNAILVGVAPLPSSPGMPLQPIDTDLRQQKSPGRLRPMTVQEAVDAKPFSAGELAAMGGVSDEQVKAQERAQQRMTEIYKKAEEDRTRKAKEQQALRDELIKKHLVLYTGAMGAMQGLEKATADVVSAMLTRQNVERLKGVAIIQYAAASGLKAEMDMLAEKAKKKGLEQQAEALASFPNFLAMAKHEAAALAWFALAGGASGIGAAAMSGADARLQAGLSNAEKQGTQLSGGSASGAPAADASAQIVNAAGGTTNVTYQLNITYQSAMVYGYTGVRDFIQREIIPGIREARARGQLA